MAVTLGTLAFASVLWALIGYLGLKRLDLAADERDAIHEIQFRLSEARAAEDEFLLYALSNPQFHETGTCPQLEDHQAAIQIVRQRLNRLRQISSRQDLVERIERLTTQYDQTCAQLSLACRTRGFKDWGLVGQFRDAVHSLEDAFNELNQPALLIELLQMRRAEKDYLLRHEEQYIEKVEDRIARLTEATNTIDATSTAGLQSTLDTYGSTFQNLVAIDRRIGTQDGEGLKNDIRVIAASIHDVVDQMVARADSNQQAIKRQTATMSAAVLVLGIILAIIASTVFSRTVTQPLTALMAATGRVARGNVSELTGVSSRDEIGELARSFDEMTTTLRDVARMADEVSSGNYSAEFKCRGDHDTLGVSLAQMTEALRTKTEDNDRKTRELQAAVQAQARFRAALDASADAVFLIDRETLQPVDMNLTACTCTGYGREELLALNLSELSPAFTEKLGTQNSSDRASARDTTEAIQTTIRRRDGAVFPVEIFTSSLESDGHSILVATVHDLTERRRSEAQVEALHRQLVDSARQAGKAEIATSVLHNVGNVLNSVNVSAEQIQDAIHRSGIPSLARAASVVEEHIDDLADFVTRDERGRHLPQFLRDLSQQMLGVEQQILEEVHSLVSDIDHIKSVVTTQQSYAKGQTAGMVEQVSVAELLKDAVHINNASMTRHSVEVSTELDNLPLVFLDKHRLLQIVINLISNAKYSCIENEQEDAKRISVCLRRTDACRLAIAVQDNGVGIAKENLTRIFAHGFTTREEGHGFGLHSAALAAEEMGGSLTVTSEGPGQGAVFTLEVPFSITKESTCTTN